MRGRVAPEMRGSPGAGGSARRSAGGARRRFTRPSLGARPARVAEPLVGGVQRPTKASPSAPRRVDSMAVPPRTCWLKYVASDS